MARPELMVLCGKYPREYKTKLAAVYAAIAEVKRAAK